MKTRHSSPINASASVLLNHPLQYLLVLVFFFAAPSIAVAGSCTALDSLPFVTVDLEDGVGPFGTNAIAESWSVECPTGISPCPAVAFPSFYTALQAGTYTVTYTKTVGGGSMEQCQYPLRIGATGLQAELQWDWDNIPDNGSVDLDLHVHLPNNTAAWGGNQGNAVVCAWNNCTVSSYQNATGVNWFGPGMPPDPVDWYLSPVLEENSCYFAPRGIGADWQSIGMGCHNPRLDIDNVACDPTVTDPQDSSFCNPEVSNIDYPPNDEWTRIAVHYFDNGGESVDIHPQVTVACRGQSPTVLGPTGYDQPVTFPAADGGDLFWIVADALFHRDPVSGASLCVVRPLYADEMLQTPILITVAEAQISVGPNYLQVTDLSLELQEGQPVLPAGGQSQYLVKVENNGPDDAFGARVMLTLPPELSDNSWTCTPDPGASCASSGGPGLDQFFNVPSGGAVRYLVTINLPTDAPEVPVTLSGEVESPESYIDVVSTNNADSVSGVIGLFGDGLESGIEP
ncbi:MAG TPA: hypothetical protein VJ984_01815 [Xanthomonadales bacterium]|nr:hypothetical protein [Xanthomonadales bacterium]